MFGKVGEPLGQAAQAIATPTAGLVTSPENAAGFGRGVGAFARGLPRMAADVGLWSAKKHPAARALGLADVALKSWSETPPTASPLAKAGAAALQTGSFFGAPEVGGRLAGIAEGAVPSMAQRFGRAAGTLGAMKAGESGALALTGQDPSQPWQMTPENIGGSLAAVAPFELIDHYIRQKELAKKDVLTEEREKSPEVPREPVPVDVPQTSLESFRPGYRLGGPQGTVITADSMKDGHGGAFAKASSIVPLDDPRWRGYEEGFKNMETGEWLNRQQWNEMTGSRTSESMPEAKLSTSDKDFLTEMEKNGAPVDQLAKVAQNLTKLADRQPGESLTDYIYRSLGIDPTLHEAGEPTSLLTSVQGFAKRYFGDVLGLPPDEEQRLTATALRVAAIAGKGQESTRVVPAIPTLDEQGRTTQGFYVKSRGEVPNAFIGLTVHPEPFQGIYNLLHTLSHELFHGHEATTKDATMGELYAQAATMNHQEMVDSIAALSNSLAAKSGKPPTNYFERRTGAYTEDFTGRREFLADLHGLASMGAVSPTSSRSFKAIDDMLAFGSGPFTKSLRGWLQDLSKVFDLLGELGKKALGVEPSTGKKLADINQNIGKLLRSAEDADNMVKGFLQMQDARSARPWNPINPVTYDAASKLVRSWDAWDSEMQAMVKEVSPLVLPQMNLDPVVEGKRYRWWDFFTATSQIGNFPGKEILADMSHLGRDYGSLAHQFVNNIRAFYRDPETQKEGYEDLMKVGKEGSPHAKAWTELTLRQDEWQEAHDGAQLPHDELMKMPSVAGLSKEDQQMIVRLNDQRGSANVWCANKTYDSFRAKVGFAISKGLMSHDLSLNWEDAEKVGRAFASLYMDQDVYTLAPHVAAERWGTREKHQMVVAEYLAKGPEQAKALEHMKEVFARDEQGAESPLAQVLSKYREKLLGGFKQDPKSTLFDFDQKPGWSPEVRLGRWIIAHKEKGQPAQFNGYKEKAQYDAALAKLNEKKMKGELEYLKYADKTDTQDDFAGMDPDKFGAYNTAVEAMNKRVIARMGNEHPEMSGELRQELLDELKPGRALAAMLESPHMKERRLIGGRENLNMGEGLLHYYNNTAYTIAKRYEIAQQNLFLKDPKMRDNPNYVKQARAYFNEITEPTEHGYKFLKQLIAFNYIFFSPSLAFVELTQQGTNHIPALLMQGMGFKDALDATRRANLDVANAYIRGKRKGIGFDDYDNDELTRVMKLAGEKNITGAGVGWNQEFWELAHDVETLNARNVFGGNGTVLDRTGLIGKPLYQMYKLGTNLHGIAIALNTKVAFKSAYEHFRSKGMEEEQAFREAEKLTVESMHGGGRASRPLWYLGIGPGSPGATVGSIMYSLQMYVYNTVAQMGNYLHQAIKNSAKNPMEISQAHKAAATMLMSQLVLAGVGGIPLTNQLIALVEQLFPNTEPRRRMREAFFGTGKWLNSKTHLVGNDEDMGGFLQTAASDGLMSTVAPWNMSNRFELGVLMGVDPYRGFDWKNVVGPGGPLIENYLTKVVPELGKGNYEEGMAAAIPNSNLRRLVQQTVHGFELRNQDSRLNAKLDTNEKTLLALGFTPKKVADFRALDQMKRRAEKVHSLEQKQFHEGMVDRLASGDQEGVTQGLLRRAREMPNYDPRAGARRIAELYQQRTLPYDPLRTGSKTSKSYTIGKLFDLPHGEAAGSIPEADRYLQRIGITQGLKFPEKVSRQSLVEAQLVDQLMRVNPSMSREEAIEMLQRQLHPGQAARVQSYASQPY